MPNPPPPNTQKSRNTVAGDGARGLAMKRMVFSLLSLEALDMKTFIKAVKKILSNTSEEMLEALFLKVDLNCNGFITWVRRAPLLPPRAGGGWEAWAVAGQRGTRRAEDLGDRFWGTFWVEGTLGVFKGALLRLLRAGLVAACSPRGTGECVTKAGDPCMRPAVP